MLDTWVKHVETVWVKSEKEKVGFIDIDGLKAKLSRQTVQPKEEQNDFSQSVTAGSQQAKSIWERMSYCVL